MLEEDGFPRRRTSGEISGNAVIERELVLLDQHHDGRGYELFADGPRLKNRLRADRGRQFDVRQTVSLGEENVSALVDADGDAGNVLPGHFRAHQGVDRLDLPGAQRARCKWVSPCLQLAAWRE